MMFRTELTPIHADFQIGLASNLLSMGSCFAQSMGKRLFDHKFQISTNPGGILFNPMSIFKLLDLALEEKPIPDWSYVQRQGMKVSYLLHSDWAAEEQSHLAMAGKGLLDRMRERLAHTDLVILTFGTAFVYQLKANGELVANCHKVPQKQFAKKLLSVEEIVSGFQTIKEKIERLNPDIRFLLTVSPVRHTREGLPQNNLSKSILRMACHELCEAGSNVTYFPAYEIMLDDLRDYRFYEKDLIHPNEQAQDYIWQQFSQTYFDDETLSFVNEWAKVKSALAHKPFDAQSEEHQQFLKATLKKLQNFSEQVDVSEEIERLQSQMNNA